MANSETERYVGAVIALLQEDDALHLLPKVADALVERAAELAEETTVTSAIALDDPQKQLLREALETDDIIFKVDEGVLGGLIVEQYGQRVDLSLKGRII